MQYVFQMHPEISENFADIEEENRSSIRVAEKLGMVLRGKSSFHGLPVLEYAIARKEKI